jgi:catechol 2,3-dioxygenase-like lactoylglutathione lyase family enzyme
MTLANNPTTTILPVTDTDRAQHFYAETLGLPFLGDDGNGTLLFGLAQGACLGLMEKEAGAQSGNTTISFEVSGIESVIQEMKSAGVHFEEYDLPGLHTVDYICMLNAEKAAWFTDPDGNILCLHEHR